MGRVSEKTIYVLNEFMDALPDEVKGKCALCNETLTHIVKQAEVETGAGTATVTKELAKEINKKVPEGDRVSPGALRQRVRQKEGLNDRESICRNPTNNYPLWTEDQEKRKALAVSGKTVVANISKDEALIQWARDNAKYVFIGRGKFRLGFGNPFEINKDGDRKQVCEKYKKYFRLKNSLHPQLDNLKGVVLGCYCYPEQCHGDHLAAVLNGKVKI